MRGNLRQYGSSCGARKAALMRNLIKFVTIAGVIFAVIILGVTLGWFGAGAPPTHVQPPADSNATPSVSRSANSVTSSAAKTATVRTAPRTNRPAMPLPPAGTNVVADWEDKLDAILTSDGEESAKAKQLLEMFPRLPEDGQVEVAQHLSNLVADEDYAPLGKMLTDAKLPEAVLDVLLADVLNRPN